MTNIILYYNIKLEKHGDSSSNAKMTQPIHLNQFLSKTEAINTPCAKRLNTALLLM